MWLHYMLLVLGVIVGLALIVFFIYHCSKSCVHGKKYYEDNEYNGNAFFKYEKDVEYDEWNNNVYKDPGSTFYGNNLQFAVDNPLQTEEYINRDHCKIW